MEYNFNDIESKWQKYWSENKTFKVDNKSDKPKYYVLDMFPYPSGAGLHVGHPLGYIASDIYARYKRHKGFNVLHPQGYDSFGLPTEQYAIQTGLHPESITKINIKTYRKQLDNIGFSFDWNREVITSSPTYYKWTQWIFIQLFNSWYNIDNDKAEDIKTLINQFEKYGNTKVNAYSNKNVTLFSSKKWNNYSKEKQQQILLKYRLAYLSETEVNWCPFLGTVLANDEIVNGISERGGHSVIRKKMTQWSMRISAYAQRLLDDLKKIDWPQPLKDAQINWIGRSQGTYINFKVTSSTLPKKNIEVFTTRPDTIFGVTFITLAPEHKLVSEITIPTQKAEVDSYIKETAKRSELERTVNIKRISGVFTGAYAKHPFTEEKIEIWIGDYVLARYGTGAVMAVPCGDQRDWNFAKHFNIKIKNIFKDIDVSERAYTEKNAVLKNSKFLNDLNIKEAIKLATCEIEKCNFGKEKTNYRLCDAVFSRQRYWGEPFPVYYKNDLPQIIDTKHLPIVLPKVEKYLPTKDGKAPLGNAKIWAWDCETSSVVSNKLINNSTVFPLELNTMPGWAGSSWYFNRYMDPSNENEFVGKDALEYWQNVDLYIGGSEHATGHLLYARFWQKFLFDRGYLPVDEFAKKLINQGMILGTSAFVYAYRLNCINNSRGNISTNIPRSKFFFINEKTYLKCLEGKVPSQVKNWIEKKYGDKNNLGFKIVCNNTDLFKMHVDISLVNNSDELDIETFKDIRKNYKDAIFIGEKGEIIDGKDGVYKVGREVEKMSKSKYNVVNPNEICKEYGADALRLFEMFLGPLEQSKPWKTSGISGVFSFLKKFWNLYFKDGRFNISERNPTKYELKILHKTIKKVEEDIENFSFNTSVSAFMIAVNELSSLKCNKKTILEPLLILISPYAPHIAEELWSQFGHTESISTASFPVFEESYLEESSNIYPISFNGKIRFTLELPLNLTKDEIENRVMKYEKTITQLKGRSPKKIIVVIGRVVNIVI